MATITFRIQGKKNPSAIYLRFKDGNVLDIEAKTGLLVNPENWDKKKRCIRNVLNVPNRVEINNKLSKLSLSIIDAYNISFSSGEVINRKWLEKYIFDFFHRPETLDSGKVDETKIYFSKFCQDWLNTKSPKHKVSANKFMDETTIGHYQQVLDNWVEFEKNELYLIKNITNELLDNFSIFLSNNKGYAQATAKRKIGRVKFFLQRAESENLQVNKNYKERIFVQEEDVEYKEPYLSEDEINAIFKYNFSDDKYMEAVRDNFIIGLWSGLRISDFLTRLNVKNINDGFIKIKTFKTNTWVTIPIHPQVEFILNKRNGNLPNKIPSQKFNRKIKIIAQLCDIDVEMIGGVVKIDPLTGIKRKVIGVYKKYELVTSHIARRSFATNLFGKIPNKTLIDICGWSSEDMLMTYNKTTNMESAMVLKKYWENQKN